MQLIEGVVQIEFIDMGRGLNGSFDENDPADVPLLDLTASTRANEEDPVWLPMLTTSTRVPATTPGIKQVLLLEWVCEKLHGPLTEPRSVQNSLDLVSVTSELAWMSPSVLAEN